MQGYIGVEATPDGLTGERLKAHRSKGVDKQRLIRCVGVNPFNMARSSYMHEMGQ